LTNLVNYIKLITIMMKMSTKSTYALKALLYLARNSNGSPENLHRVSKQQQIPLPYLEQIFSTLKKAGLVKAVRGPHGGFLLARPPAEITLAQIIMVLEGPFEPILCSFPEKQSSQCHHVEGCVSRAVCNELDGAVLGVLNSKTLGSLCEEADQISH